MKALHVIGLCGVGFLTMVGGMSAIGQVSVSKMAVEAPAAQARLNVIVPQARRMGPQSWRTVYVSDVDADVVIRGQVATTTVEVVMQNNTGAVQEAEVVLPVPDGATLVGFSIDGPGSGIEAQLMERAEATRIYEGIVNSMRDPGLLEFVGYNMIKSSVFPVAPNGQRRARIVYEQLLERDGSRIDYVLPRSSAAGDDMGFAARWSIDVRLNASGRTSTIYSPSHEIAQRKTDTRTYEISLDEAAAAAPGAFRLSWVVADDRGVTPTVMMYPALDGEAGYFLMLAGAPEELSSAAEAQGAAREVTLVIDRSGSMGGEKLAQALESARQVIHGLKPGERFNILTYSDSVERFQAQSVVKSAATVADAMAYLQTVTARGGTNLHGALAEALHGAPTAGTLPLVLFLTDGLPTVGDTSEASIRGLAEHANPHERRVYTFGVGNDVNAPLLTAIADDSRGSATFVHPGEDVEAKVGSVFAKLRGPVLASPRLVRAGVHRAAYPPPMLFDVIPGDGELPDLFTGDQLVIVGRYAATMPFDVELQGEFLGSPMSFGARIVPAFARPTNSFIPRLWASRQIASLIDSIRRLGADPNLAADDPRVKELTDEVVRLSLKHGVMTEYTAFLAREDASFASRDEAIGLAAEAMEERAIRQRSGAAGVSQSVNNQSQRRISKTSDSNQFFDKDMKRVAITTVQQAADRAIFNRNGRWIDGELADESGEIEADREVAFGSKEHLALAGRFFREGRQALLAQAGDILLVVDGEKVLIRSPEE